MRHFLEFLKGMGIMLSVVALLITIIGAISTGDVVFVITGVATLLVAGYIGYRVAKRGKK